MSDFELWEFECIFSTLKREMLLMIDERKHTLEDGIYILEKDLMRAEKSRKDQLESELEDAKEKMSSYYEELKSIGIFRIAKRIKIERKLRENKKHIKSINNELMNVDSGEIRRLKEKLKEKRDKLQIYSDDTNIDNWTNRLNVECEEYQERYKLHHDYEIGRKMHLKSMLSPEEVIDFECKMEMYDVCTTLGRRATLSEIKELCPSLKKGAYGTADVPYAASIAGSLVKDGALKREISNNTVYFGVVEQPQIPMIDDTGWDIKVAPRKPKADDFLPEI